MAKRNLPPNSLLRAIDIANYLGVNRMAVHRWIKAGKLVPAEVSPTDPRQKFFKAEDVEAFKQTLLSEREKTLTNLEFPSQTQEDVTHEVNTLPPGAVSERAKTTQILEDTSLTAQLLEAAKVPNTLTIAQGQMLVRKQLLVMAAKNKVITRLFKLLESPDPRVQLRTIETILNKIVPDLKSIEYVADAETQAQNHRLQEVLEKLREDIRALCAAQVPKTIETEAIHLPIQEGVIIEQY